MKIRNKAQTTKRVYQEHVLPNLRNTAFSKFIPTDVLGQGQFGVVFAAKTAEGDIFAIKQLEISPSKLTREIDILTELDHPNCIKFVDSLEIGVSKYKKRIYIAMSYLPIDLDHYLDSFVLHRKRMPLIEIKLFSYQILCGLRYLHSKSLVHRDLKPQNIIIDPDTGCLQICDFGNAKRARENEKSTTYIGSRHYRAPELILNKEEYGCPIDIWAAGCVIAQLIYGKPIFPGTNTLSQMDKIIAIIGKPTYEDLTSYNLTSSVILSSKQQTSLEEVLPDDTEKSCFDLLHGMFAYKEANRWTAQQCLLSPWFDALFQPSAVLSNGNPIPQLENREL